MEQSDDDFSVSVFLTWSVSHCGNTLAPALYLFGDSSIDNGNNNLLPTLARANFFPYGIDFPRGSTGRFTNGKTIADFIAEYLGLPYPPPYISMGSSRSLTGINYASASCGILPETGANFGRCLNLRDQVNLFENTVEKDLQK
ncbi:GDSL esterase/lipase At2g03980-like [Vigna umbellata]|uniref:GDSL esterase/lipase At2g03980-like n=1 Tax=Vigna umbellata TaxID=87088 RepID=UPI001F5F3022|nr:GDSL esterase/lipase At2g03980-like [Vigna umbellata]